MVHNATDVANLSYWAVIGREPQATTGSHVMLAKLPNGQEIPQLPVWYEDGRELH